MTTKFLRRELPALLVAASREETVNFEGLLDDAGLTQAEFVTLSGFGRNSVARWCNGNRQDARPAPRHAVLLAGLLADLGPEESRNLLIAGTYG